METIYLDYHATTPQDPRVTEVMLPFFHQWYANSSSNHRASWPVHEAIDTARKTHAHYLGVSEKEVIFTGSATEANNLVFYSSFETYGKQRNHILLSPIEHKSVIKAAENLEKHGAKIEFLQVDKYGKIDLEDLQKKINQNTLLVSVIHANNEIGTIQDLKEISKIVKASGALFHSDAVQTFGKYPIKANDLNIDYITWSAHKLYGPKGVGGLYFNSKNVKMQAQIVGGAHEGGLRAGTLNTAGIVGMAKALELSVNENDSLRIQTLRNTLEQGLCDLFAAKKIEYRINGASGSEKLHNNLNITLLNIERKQIEAKLSGLCYSTGSACASGEGSPSHVLLAIGLNKTEAMNSFRLSVGRQTTLQEIESALVIFEKALS